MWAELLIVAVGLLLFWYWFRRNTLAVLKSRPVEEPAYKVAQANGLRFFEIRRRLQAGSELDGFDSIGRALREDFRLLTFLLRHAGGAEPASGKLTDHMLMLDFHLMQLWFHLSRRISRRQALRALEEMSGILGQLAESMGRRLAFSRSGILKG